MEVGSAVDTRLNSSVSVDGDKQLTAVVLVVE